MYELISDFGGFVVGVAFILWSIGMVFNLFYCAHLEKQQERQFRELYRKRGRWE